MAAHGSHWHGKEAMVNDTDYDDIGTEPTAEADRRAPVGLNLQLVATGLLVLALVAIAWLFLADSGQQTALETATPQVVSSQAAMALTQTAVPTQARGTVTSSPQVVATAIPTGVSGSAGVTTGIAAGGFVKVQGTDTYGLRLRFGPGPDYATIRIVEEGEIFRVLGGPESAPPDIFWRVQDAQGNIGWAAAAYLVPTAAPALWSPPPATPLPQSGAGASGAAEGTATP